MNNNPVPCRNLDHPGPGPRYVAGPWSPHLWKTPLLLVFILFPSWTACSDDGTDGSNGNHNTNGNINQSIDPTCTTLRVTHYTGGPRGWCEFSRELPILPEFARQGLTAAVAEPWNGGSYGGPPGQACGECWEVSSAWATKIIMITDLCPIEGNPICAGGFFHLDLLDKAAEALQTKGLDATSARRVPCPVTGNIHVVVNDWNQWGYMRVAFVNHRIPIKSAWVRLAPDGDWRPFERSGGAWQIHDAPKPDEGDGVQFRFESAQNQIVEGERVVAFHTGVSHDDPAVEDTGVQFDDQGEETQVCEYLPPGLVYGDEYGGIDELRWQPNPWDGVDISETNENCHNGSSSCLKIEHLGDWNGFHIYYYPAFPRDTFSTLEIWGRTGSGSISVQVSASHDGQTCAMQDATFTEQWTLVTIGLPTACSDLDILSSITLHSGKDGGTLYLDDIRFSP